MTKEKAEEMETRLMCITDACVHYLWGDCGLKKTEIEDGVCKQFVKKEKST